MGIKVYTGSAVKQYSGSVNFDEDEAGSKPPNGPAGGDLGATYPNPTVVAVEAGGTRLAVAAVADGQMVVRSGANLQGAAVPVVPSSLPPSGAAGGDLGSTYPSPTVVGLHSGATALAIGSIADGQMVVRSGANLQGQAIPSGSSFDVATSAPASWYRASLVSSSGGQVDSITDSGSLGFALTSTGADRCPLGTDGDGKVYLDMAADLYTAAASALSDWRWLHDGTTDWTIGLVYSKPTWPGASTTPLGFLSTMNWTTSMGFALMAGVSGSGTGGGGGGSYWGWEGIIMPNAQPFNMQVASAKAGTPPTTKQVVMFRFNRTRVDVQYNNIGAGNVMGNPIGSWGDQWQQGALVTRQSVFPNQTFGATDPAGKLTLGGFASGASRFTGRVYELVAWKRRLTDADAEGYAKAAATTYVFSL